MINKTDELKTTIQMQRRQRKTYQKKYLPQEENVIPQGRGENQNLFHPKKTVPNTYRNWFYRQFAKYTVV